MGSGELPQQPRNLREAVTMCYAALEPIQKLADRCKHQEKQLKALQQQQQQSRFKRHSEASLPLASVPTGSTVSSAVLEGLNDELQSDSKQSDSNTAKAEGASQCSICELQIGKRHLHRKFQCQVCNECVCNSCSQSQIKFSSQKGLQRVCVRCVADVEVAPILRMRMVNIARQVQAISSTPQSTGVDVSSVTTLTAGVDLCEQALTKHVKG